MKLVLQLLVVLVFSSPVSGQLYEWVDEKGSVNFTDDPDRIPAKYRNRAKPREETIKASPPEQRNGERGKPSTLPVPPTAGPKYYDGRVLSWWQAEHGNRVRQVEGLKGELARLLEEENVARRKKVTYGRLSDRKRLAEKRDEVAAKEAQVKSAEQDLAEFRAYAERSGLSVNMLGSGTP